MAHSITVSGPAKLRGTVKIQGAKNSVLKHILVPLIGPGIYHITNVPEIQSTYELLKLVELFGVKISHPHPNEITLDSTGKISNTRIPKDLFYATSGGIHIVPIIVHLFGTCEIESDFRADTGGDQIGRGLDKVISFLSSCGINTTKTGWGWQFNLINPRPLNLDVPKRALGATVNAILCSLFRNGISQITSANQDPEVDDIIGFLNKAGANVKLSGDQIIIIGPAKLHGIKYRNIDDKNDLATWILTAVATDSDIAIKSQDFVHLKTQPLANILDRWGISLHFEGQILRLNQTHKTYHPVDISADSFPAFHSDWQEMLSPILTQIPGTSAVREKLYLNRLRHWQQLSLMGARFKYVTDPLFPENNGQPRVVEVAGLTPLHGASVRGDGVRFVSGLIIAGLIAEGKTIIEGYEHIERGYEDFAGRLSSLGAQIKLSATK